MESYHTESAALSIEAAHGSDNAAIREQTVKFLIIIYSNVSFVKNRDKVKAFFRINKNK